MVNEVHRILVDKEKIRVEGRLVMRLYFYDTMDGYVLMYDAPILKSRGVPLMASEEEPQEEEPIMEEALPVEDTVQDTPVQELVEGDNEDAI